jgi:tetratricopeptide (TPR) repeat protein
MTLSDDPIWSIDALRECLGHDHPTVRLWALRRLGRELGDEEVAAIAADLLEDADRSVALEAFRLFEPAAVPAHLDALRYFCEREDIFGPVRARVGGLLAALGDETIRGELIDEIGSQAVRWSIWSERAPDDFAAAVDEARGDGDLPSNVELLRGVALAAHGRLAGPLLDAVDAVTDAQARRALLALLVERAGFGLVSLPEPGRIKWDPEAFDDLDIETSSALVPREVRRADVERLADACDRRDWPAFVEVCIESVDTFAEHGAQELDSVELGWAFALADALRERADFGASDEERARLAYSVLACAELVFGIETALDEGPDWSTLLRLRDRAYAWEEIRVDELIAERWAASAGDETARTLAADALAEWLADKSCEDPVDFIDVIWLARTLDGLDLGPWADELTELLEESRDDDGYDREIYEVLEQIWIERPSLLRKHAAGWIGFDSALGRAVIFTLGDLNARWASELVLERFDEFLAQEESQDLWENIQELGDVAALEDVVEAWKPGERQIARCAAFLARLADRLDELPEELVDDAERARQSSEQGIELFEQALKTGQMPWDVLEEDTLVLDLRCTECGRTHSYEADQVFIDPEALASEEPDALRARTFVDRIITCKSCGAVDDYELTSRAHLALLPRLMRLKDSADPLGEQIVVARRQLYDGTVIVEPSKAIAYLEENASRHPLDGEAWRRLGNLCERYSEPKKAERAWRKAVEVDDTEAEAAYSLAEQLWVAETPNVEAFNFAIMALERLPGTELDEESRWAVAFKMLDMLRAYLPVVDPPIALRAAWSDGHHGDSATLNMSEVDLRRIHDWDRLVELFAQEAFAVVQFTTDLPDNLPTMLERLINQPGPFPASLQRAARKRGAGQTYVKPQDEDIGRNDPCPCGSGRKYKKCCLRKQ